MKIDRPENDHKMLSSYKLGDKWKKLLELLPAVLGNRLLNTEELLN